MEPDAAAGGSRSCSVLRCSEEQLDGFVADGDLVREGRWIYRPQIAALEAELAQRVTEMVGGPRSARLSAPDPQELHATGLDR